MITTTIDARIYNEMQSYGLNAEERLVFLTLMLSLERSLIGIHKLDVDTLKLRTRLTKSKIVAAIQRLNEAGLIIGDEKDGECYTPFMLKSNTLKGGKTYRVYFEDLQRVKNSHLIELLVMDVYKMAPVTFIAALIDADYGKLIPNDAKKYTAEELDQARNAYVKPKNFSE